MPRRRRIAHQHHVFMIPLAANHPRELHPDSRAAQVRRVRHQIMPAKMGRKDLAAGFHRFFLGHIRETPAVPGIGQAFHDEGRSVVVELVDMRPDPAMLGLLEDEGEGVVELGMGAKPDELALAQINIGLEHLLVFAPHQGIDAIRRHDDIVFLAVFFSRFELGLKAHIHAQFPRAGLQQDQHRLAANPCKSMPARHRANPVMHHRNIVPIGEIAADRLGRDRIILLHPPQRVIRQHHTPAERIVGLVALHHDDLVRRVAQLHRDCEVKTGGATAQAQNLHGHSPICVEARVTPAQNNFKLEISSLKFCRSGAEWRHGKPDRHTPCGMGANHPEPPRSQERAEHRHAGRFGSGAWPCRRRSIGARRADPRGRWQLCRRRRYHRDRGQDQRRRGG
jgi:hypothetical protein